MNEQTALSFDFGMRRIGVAVGQTVTQTARPLLTLAAKAGIPEWHKVAELVKLWQPTILIIGIPLNMDGSEQAITSAARGFGKQLQERFQIPLAEVDERLTSTAAREHLFNYGGYKALQKGQIDSAAATLILQSWLDNLSITFK